MTRSARLQAALPLLAALAAAPLAATSILPTSDEALVDKAELIVEGTIESKTNFPADRPATDWLVRVDRVLKGELGSSTLIVRVPGGETAGGKQLRIHGAPSFAPRMQTILFLGRERNGVRRIVDFPQGAFLAGEARSRDLAFRDLSQVLDAGTGRRMVRDPMRDADKFADWIEARAEGLNRFKTYVVKPRQSEVVALAEEFNLLIGDGLPMRWFEFDAGGSVTIKSHQAGQAGLASLGAAELQRALSAWNNEPSTPIRLEYGGTTPIAAGFTEFDEENVVLWNDPNDEMEGSPCTGGGTLAIGGAWTDSSVRSSFGGRSFLEILAGDIVVNDGLDCYRRYLGSTRFSYFIEDTLAHELGHVLGLHHSSENYPEPRKELRNALMYWALLAWPSGHPRLDVDDVDGLRALYVTGGGGGSFVTSPHACPGDRLCLGGGRFVVTAEWENQFDDTNGWAGAIPSTDVAGFLYFTDPSNIELAVKVADFGTEIKVFYSQLTNLKFKLYVTDMLTGHVKTYTNTAGDCGAIDNDFMSSAAAATASATAGMTALAEAATVGGCGPAGALCLLGGRFSITVDWRNQFTGASGSGIPRKLTDLSGAFAFDNASNLELLIKTLDFGDHVLVLYGALSNLEYSIRVTEVATGKTKTYSNPAGKFCGGIDNNF